ncbi:hypothetical protein K1T71_008845 [Dendrolimus kikuchii]|uniref:Uncharacterized protein n=1 Tax=Dendrolimus kikuchii TaxID=765133 RepID=A0ACC1CVS3_9NEOP|nr:hypothetical protein K1T71_008845 [Dendrolimus kikuchii]
MYDVIEMCSEPSRHVAPLIILSNFAIKRQLKAVTRSCRGSRLFRTRHNGPEVIHLGLAINKKGYCRDTSDLLTSKCN